MTKVILVFVLLTAAVAGFWFFSENKGLDLGVTTAKPLGDFAKFEKHFTGLGLVKGEISAAEASDLFGNRLSFGPGNKLQKYTDTRVPSLEHKVVVVQDEGGNVVGVAAKFRSGSFEFSKTGTKCERFTAFYWLGRVGGPPDFRKEMEEGSDRQEYRLATASRGGVDAVWRKDTAGGVVAMSHEVVDTVSFVRR